MFRVGQGPHSHESSFYIEKVIDGWKIPENKSSLVVSDNVSNIKNAVEIKLRWKGFGYFAHTVNLILKNALAIENIQPEIEKVKIIVGHFKKSINLNQKQCLSKKIWLLRSVLKKTGDH